MAPWPARKRNRLVISPRGLIADRGTVRVEIETGDQAVLVLSVGFPSDREMTRAGCTKRRGARLEIAPHQASRLFLQDARRGAWPRPQDVAAACPTSLPEPLHRPAMTKRTAVPTLGTRSALRAALRPTNSRPSSTASIARTSCAPRGHGDAGGGHNPCPSTRAPRTCWKIVTTMRMRAKEEDPRGRARDLVTAR